MTVKITYADMKSITRSKAVESCDSAIEIYREALQLFDQVDKRPIRLIGAGIYNLSTEYKQQLSFDDYINDISSTQEKKLKEQFDIMRRRYGLDFEGHLPQIYRWDTLHRTAEYMRKHIITKAPDEKTVIYGKLFVFMLL